MKKITLFLLAILFLFALLFTLCNRKKATDVDLSIATVNQTSNTRIIDDSLISTVTILSNDTNDTSSLSSSLIITVEQDSNKTITLAQPDSTFESLSDTSIFSHSITSCDTIIPCWGESLGTVSFATTKEWTITNGTITQVWSDAVQATNCNKTNYCIADSKYSYIIDCRSNPKYPGDLFSWYAVVCFKDELCPAPWRVPTSQDFIDLDIALGGTGHNQIDNTLQNKYFNHWGATYGGTYSIDSYAYGQIKYKMLDQGSVAFYWTQSEENAFVGLTLRLDGSGRANPLLGSFKGYAHTLRCIR